MNKFSKIKRACEINDVIFKEIISDFNFETEKDIERFILKRFEDFKVGKSFPPIVANNYSVVHAKPRNIKLRKGFCVLDFGARYKNMCSDMTRTIFLGKASKYEKQLYNLIYNCQKNSIQKVKSIVNCNELYEYAKRLLGQYKKYFPHGLGHGVGYRVHVKPRIKPNSKDTIKKGDFITIEPGIYIKNKNKEFGIRIEDTVYVGKKVEILTKSPKKLIEINLNF